MAERAGISRAAVSAIEVNRLVPSVTAALALAKALGCAVEDLFSFDPYEQAQPEWAWPPTRTPSRYWRATGLPGSSQRDYQVMPADYTLMAIPLSAGTHLLRLDYAPSGWIIGRWISLAGLLIYLTALTWWLLDTRHSRRLSS